jgi:hypothetical protein
MTSFATLVWDMVILWRRGAIAAGLGAVRPPHLAGNFLESTLLQLSTYMNKHTAGPREEW